MHKELAEWVDKTLQREDDQSHYSYNIIHTLRQLIEAWDRDKNTLQNS